MVKLEKTLQMIASCEVKEKFVFAIMMKTWNLYAKLFFDLLVFMPQRMFITSLCFSFEFSIANLPANLKKKHKDDKQDANAFHRNSRSFNQIMT
jgi:hypothetical protein